MDKKINYGEVDIPAEEFADKNVKIRISIWIDGDVLSEFKKAAEKKGIGYQTLINLKLKESVEEAKTLEQRVSDLESIVRMVRSRPRRRLLPSKELHGRRRPTQGPRKPRFRKLNLRT